MEDLVSRDELKRELASLIVGGEEAIKNAGYGHEWKNGLHSAYRVIKNAKSKGKGFTDNELRLIGEAVDYLLGADLVEENGWTKNDIATLKRIQKRTEKYI